ncbi:hypothetical protein H5410_046945 [Solanum commersonii]|uniref:Uncharacterized protein n=1 Tax=Solanum commersonii TaxID=4109 RepID=A0A9J5XFT7_SOLCO|nr:hypothetical protein H5410_046945 [Solanum commersonii]
MEFQTPKSSSVPSIAPPRFAAPHTYSSAAKYVAEQKSSERFVRLVPHKFDNTTGEKAYDFLTECQDKLFNQVSKYEAHFHELSRYAMSSIPTEFERICKLIMGFASYLQEITVSFVLSSGTFQSIIDHARMIESILHARQGSCAKKFHLQGQFSSHSSKGKDYSGQGL